MNDLTNLWKRGCDFLGTQYAILGGAMTWISEHNLVSALSNAGGFGVIASGSMPPESLKQEIQKTFQKTKQPFGVNLITLNPYIQELIEICIAEKVSHVVLAGGLPKQAMITPLKTANIKVLAFAPALIIAKKLIKMGVDALIIEGMEAGGHIGPVSTSVLAQEILPHITEVPIFMAGGIGRGESIVSYLQMGASGCQMGTIFVCAKESIAHPEFKKAFLRAHAREATVSMQLDPRFPVIPVRAIENKAKQIFLAKQREIISLHEKGTLTLLQAQEQIEYFWAGALRKAVIEGDIENGSLMAGQSVGLVTKEQPTKEILEALIEQAQANLLKIGCQKYVA